MARLFLSASLGVALALSSATSGFAATTASGLANTLSGQPGVSSQLLQAVSNVQVQCETPGATSSAGGQSACRAALQALVGTVPTDLSPALTNEINELVSARLASLPPEGQTGAVPGATAAPAAANPGGGNGGSDIVDNPNRDDAPASAGAAG